MKTKNYKASNGEQYQVSGGVNTGFTFSKNGKESVLGFESESETKEYIERREKGECSTFDRDDNQKTS